MPCATAGMKTKLTTSQESWSKNVLSVANPGCNGFDHRLHVYARNGCFQDLMLTPDKFALPDIKWFFGRISTLR